MVPKSRLSIPLFAAFVLVLASYITYLVVTKNIFRLQLVDHYFNSESTFYDNRESASGNSLWAHFFNRTDKAKTPNKTSAKKVIVVGDKKVNEPTAPDSVSNNEPEVIDQPVASTAPDSVDADTFVNSVTWAPASREYELRALWKKYSERVPPLYSEALNKTTEETLGRVAQISADLDKRYSDDKNDWINHLEEERKNLIDIAVNGEREGARALSFQYVRPPLSRTAEALTWAMIANAISPNDYYLYICSNEFSLCSEGLFDQASLQAKSYSDIYHFTPRAQSPYKK